MSSQSRSGTAFLRKPPQDIYLTHKHRDESDLVVQGHGGTAFISHSLFNGKQHRHWPTRTDICCFHHEKQFEGAPVFIPLQYDRVRNLYTVFGVFCSPACAKAYILEHFSHKKAVLLMLLSQLLKDVYCVVTQSGEAEPFHGVIVAAAPRSSFAKYGGPYSLEEVLSRCRQVKVISHSATLITHAMVYEERPVLTTGIETNPDATAPVSALSDASGKQWNVRGLRIPKGTSARNSVNDRRVSSASAASDREQTSQYATKGMFDQFVTDMQDATPDAAQPEDDEFGAEVDPPPAKRAKRGTTKAVGTKPGGTKAVGTKPAKAKNSKKAQPVSSLSAFIRPS